MDALCEKGIDTLFFPGVALITTWGAKGGPLPSTTTPARATIIGFKFSRIFDSSSHALFSDVRAGPRHPKLFASPQVRVVQLSPARIGVQVVRTHPDGRVFRDPDLVIASAGRAVT